MEECNICGISGEYVKIYEAISDEKIIKICSKCANNEHIPIIRKPTTFQLNESERKHTVYERLSKVSGFKPRREGVISKEDVTLKEIVDRNYMKKLPSEPKKERPDLIENFHWVIMRARRLKHLSQKQLALEIAESERAIIMAEKGFLPDDGYKLISKLQSYLNIRLIKRSSEQEIRKISKEISFDPFLSKDITLGDIKGQMVEDEVVFPEETKKKPGFFKRVKDFFTVEEDLNLQNELTGDNVESQVEKDIKANLIKRTQLAKPGKSSDLAKKDIDKLIFGKKK